jgi:hypothetical protein
VAIKIIEYVHSRRGRPYRIQEKNQEEKEEEDGKDDDNNKWAKKREKKEVKKWTSLYINDAWQE